MNGCLFYAAGHDNLLIHFSGQFINLTFILIGEDSFHTIGNHQHPQNIHDQPDQGKLLAHGRHFKKQQWDFHGGPGSDDDPYIGQSATLVEKYPGHWKGPVKRTSRS